MKSRAKEPEETVTLNCGCGFVGHVRQVHYGLCRCRCGRIFWALRPRHGGNLVAFPWPGFPFTPTPTTPEKTES